MRGECCQVRASGARVIGLRMRVSSYITLDQVCRIRKVLPNAAGDRALGEGAKKRDVHP